MIPQTIDSVRFASELFFPRTEWQWLRKPALAPPGLKHPDEFLWAAKVRDKLWCWHPDGAEPAAAPALDAAKTTGKNTVLVLDGLNNEKTGGENNDELTAFGLYLKTTFRAQAPLEIEWVNALDVLLNRYRYDPSTSGLPPFWKEALTHAGLEPHIGVLSQRGRFLFLTQRERQALFDRRWDPAVFEILETWAPALRLCFLEAIEKWGLTASQAKEVSSSIVVLFKKLGDAAAEKFLKKDFKSPEEFRHSLLQLAQPEMAALSAARIEKLRALRVPARTAVFGDPTFESDILKIVHTPRSYADFQIFKDWIDDTGVEGRLKELLEIYRC